MNAAKGVLNMKSNSQSQIKNIYRTVGAIDLCFAIYGFYLSLPGWGPSKDAEELAGLFLLAPLSWSVLCLYALQLISGIRFWKIVNFIILFLIVIPNGFLLTISLFGIVGYFWQTAVFVMLTVTSFSFVTDKKWFI